MSPHNQLPQPPGQMVDTGGLRLHAIVRGEGSPVVLLEPALGGYALQYAGIQSAVAAFTQVMSYDRAGQGWSDPSPDPRTPEHLSGELHALLGRLGLRPPYVLVGHSFGGLLARIYAGRYPREAAGMVLVDSTHEDEYDAFPNIDKMVGQMAVLVRVMKLAGRLGLGRPLAKLSIGSAAKSLSKEDLETFAAITSRPGHQETMLAEFSQYRCYYGAQSQVPRALGDLPLVVVTAGSSVSGSGKVAGMTADAVNAQHQRLQKTLVGLSPRGEQVIVPGATHFSIFTRPDHAACVVDAIRRVVEQVRAGGNLTP